MRSFVRSFGIGLFAATMVVGCGGGSSATGAFTTGLEKTAPISSISAQGREQICSRASDWLHSATTRTEICTFFGVVFGDSEFLELSEESAAGPAVPACYNFVDTCANAPVEEEQDPDTSVQSCLLNTAESFARCNASIAELDACLADSLAVYDSIFASVSCEGAGNPGYVREQLTSIENLTQSASCLSLKAQCPGLLVDSSAAAE